MRLRRLVIFAALEFAASTLRAVESNPPRNSDFSMQADLTRIRAGIAFALNEARTPYERRQIRQKMKTAIQLFTALNFTVIGPSHIFQPQVWVDYFTWLRANGKIGAILMGSTPSRSVRSSSPFTIPGMACPLFSSLSAGRRS